MHRLLFLSACVYLHTYTLINAIQDYRLFSSSLRFRTTFVLDTLLCIPNSFLLPHARRMHSAELPKKKKVEKVENVTTSFIVTPFFLGPLTG
ncbi:hypothetical protein K504DRAFT_32946 [Pleomassaria siparia CBS 279.74]|uniref:Uncharacterized protein n=1 Tax=Pleomassaria siparia CBS 279.74 TaxID=1314801 RepID=A0A6G1KS81_9PLEO|nr:hypothetical protein K504DRAFT_32946 [Pleomassaria siparia CBS 279.74]